MVTRKESSPQPVHPALPCNPVMPQNLIGADGSDLRDIFIRPAKFVVGTTVPDPVYFQLLDYPGGISGFYEDAVAKFNLDLETLLIASARFADERKQSRQTIAIRAANGRISKAAHQKIQQIEAALKGIRGISKAKVLSGLIQLYLNVQPQ